MNIFNEKEFDELCKKFDATPNIIDVSIKYDTPGFFNKLKDSVARDRRGEVAFCVLRPSGKIIAVTCSEYPDGIFRIPTGGIGFDEDIVEAVIRETKEELGLDVSIVDFTGVIKTRFIYNEECEMFYSYLFILKEVGGRLLEDASDDEISEVKEVDLDELERIVERLDNIEGMWANWGKFRYQTSNEILKYLRGKA